MGKIRPVASFGKMSSQPLKSDVSSGWGASCRPTLLFAVAFALSMTPREVAHAITSCLLGFNSTVFQMWVNPDSVEATSRQLAILAASGPIFSLTVGAVCWVLYQRRFRDRPSGVTFVMIAMVGIYSFLGPLAGAALGGDFRTAFTLLHISMPLSYLASAIGFILLPSSCTTWEKNCCGGRLANSVARKLSLARLLHLGCLELFYSCWFIGRCRAL
jgi:hypothetical protein